MATLDEDAVDEILYLARANEAAELASYLSDLSTQTKRSSADLVIAAVDAYSKNGALHYAAANGHNGIIKLLFSLSGGDKPAPEFINIINDAGNTPLHWAALNGQLESVKLLIQSGADITIFNRAGHDAVFEAEINDKKEVVDWLCANLDELEHGIGSTGEASSDVDKHSNDIEKDATDGSTIAVEHVRKQMEDMKTRDGATKNS